MKKFIFLLAFAFVALAASAQVGEVRSLASGTLTNTATLISPVITCTSSYNALTIQVKAATVTGTTAGTSILKASVDGTNYVTINNADGLVKGWPNDTLSLSNGAVWNMVIQDAPWKYYQISTTGTNTQVTTVSYKYIYK